MGFDTLGKGARTTDEARNGKRLAEIEAAARRLAMKTETEKRARRALPRKT